MYQQEAYGLALERPAFPTHPEFTPRGLMRTFRHKMATMLAATVITGGLIAVAAPAHATGATDTPAAFVNKASAIATVAETVQAKGLPADVEPRLVRIYRGSFASLWNCDAYGRSWVSSGSARAYNCGLDNRYPGLPWSLYTFH